MRTAAGEGRSWRQSGLRQTARQCVYEFTPESFFISQRSVGHDTAHRCGSWWRFPHYFGEAGFQAAAGGLASHRPDVRAGRTRLFSNALALLHANFSDRTYRLDFRTVDGGMALGGKIAVARRG